MKNLYEILCLKKPKIYVTYPKIENITFTVLYSFSEILKLIN